MAFNAGQELKLPYSFPSAITTGQNLLKQSFSGATTFEEVLVMVDDLVFTKIGRHLSEAEITVIKGSWGNYDYEEIAKNSPYSVNYLQRRLAPQLWDILSAAIGNGERVSKKNLRIFFQKVSPQEYDTQQVTLNGGQTPFANKSIQVRGQPPKISNFYGRIQELTYLKKLIVKQRCVSLIGVAGIGKSTLASKLLAELSVESQPRFDCFIWKSVAHTPSVQDLVTDLINLIQPVEPSSTLDEYTQTRITALLQHLQSRRCLLVLDGIEALFQKNNFEMRLEYSMFFRRLVEEQHESCLLLTSRVLPNEFDSLIRAKRPIQFLKVEGLDVNAAMQLLVNQGLTDQEKCSQLIETYRGNPLELQTVAERIHHFFGGSTEIFFENKTTFFSSEVEAMLNEMFGQTLSEFQRQIMIYLAREVDLNPSKYVSFTKLLSDISNQHNILMSRSELIRVLEVLERRLLIENIKDPITKEISFTLQPVIKKYIMTDPLGLVHKSETSSTLPFAS
jgi:NB-ARC domain